MQIHRGHRAAPWRRHCNFRQLTSSFKDLTQLCLCLCAGEHSLSIEGPTKVQLECGTVNNDDTRSVSYYPTEAGEYKINIKIDFVLPYVLVYF